MTRAPVVLSMFSMLLWAGCADPSSPPVDASDSAASGSASSGDAEVDPDAPEPQDATYTYWRDAKAVIDAKCGSCHQPGDVAPFPLVTYDDVRAVAAVLPASIETDTMPPWPPAAGCEDYMHSRALDQEDRQLLLTWLDEGAPEGDPDQAPEPDPDSDPEPSEWTPTMTVEMGTAYTPVTEPDDYRCFLVPWPETQTQYITGYRVIPGNRELVHHVIMFNGTGDTVAELQALDDADPGPGYECFGGTGTQTDWIGSWVPGSDTNMLPAGTGIRIEPGSMMVLQMHYNTLSSEPASDETAVELVLSDHVDTPALTVPFTNFQWVTGTQPMHIPAGDPQVTHTFDLSAKGPMLEFLLADLDLGPDDPFVIHSAGLHMHTLGTAGSISRLRDNGDEDCMLRIDQWDFSWQGGYSFREPIRVDPQDQLRISCTWDNSAQNQPTVDGQVLEPRDVTWGEGTNDEMCLGVLYVTAD